MKTGVDEHASKQEIKAAYDEVKRQAYTPEEREHAKEAVDVLANSQKREQYDAIGYAGALRYEWAKTSCARGPASSRTCIGERGALAAV